MSTAPPPTAAESRLLALTAVPPWPSRDGYSIRASNLLRELSRRWDVTLLSPGTGASRRTDPPGGIEWIELPDLPATNILPWRPERGRLVEAAAAALADDGFAAALLWNGTEYVAGEIDGFPPAVADRIDCETLQAWRSRKHGWWSLRRRLQEIRRGIDMALYERRVLRRLRVLTVTSPVDARALSRVTGHDRVVVVSNGVRLPSLADYPDESPRPTVIFTGVLGFPPNVGAARYFVRQVWPEVKDAVPDAEFVIAGRSPVADALNRLAGEPGVTLRPDVDDMTAELRRAWVAVAPMLSGGGIKNKVLEAWAAERPVVLTELATGGLSIDERVGKLVTSSASEMAEAVCRLLTSDSMRREFGRAGRDLARRRHSWRTAVEPLEDALSEIVGEAPGT